MMISPSTVAPCSKVMSQFAVQISSGRRILEKDFSVDDFNVALDFRVGVHSDIFVNG